MPGREYGFPRLLALVTCLAFSSPFFSCQAHPGTPGGKASLSVFLVLPAQSKTLVPPLDMVPAGYTVVGAGPAGQRAETSGSQSIIVLENLDLGDWEITASALNQGGTVIAEGMKRVTLMDGQQNEVEIQVDPLPGSGTLSLTVRWPAAAVPAPSLTAGLTSSAGNEIPLVFSIESGVGTSSTQDLPGGYYTLQVQLLSSGNPVAGAIDVVRILKDQTTSGELDFTGIDGAQGSINVTVTPRLDNPIAVEIAGRQSEIGLGQCFTLKAWLAEDCPGAKSAWYVDGMSRSSGQIATLGADLAFGTRRVDLAVFSADGRRAGSSSFSIQVLAQLAFGSLSLSTFIKDGVAGVDGLNGCRSVCVSPDGSSLYACGYGDSAVAWFQRDFDTGALRFMGQLKNGKDGVQGLSGVESIAISPDGRHLYAASYTDGALAVFDRDSATGALSYLSCLKNGNPGLDGLAGARDVAVSPDGKSIYCVGYTSGTLLAFQVEPVSGTPALLQTLRDGEGEVSLLGGASSVAVAPDGSQVFVASYTDDSLLVFSRDPASGALSYSQAFSDGLSGCDGLNGADCVELSPDGSSVYVTGYYDNALAVFRREQSNGLLSFSTFLKDGAAGVNGLYYARGVAVAPDGLSVYATGSGDDAVASFSRDPAAGGLTYNSLVSGFDGARGLSVSPDGKNCYVAGSSANGLAVLNRIH